MGGYLLGGGVNWLGTYNKYGYGAENVLGMRVVLADGRVANVWPNRTEVTRKKIDWLIMQCRLSLPCQRRSLTRV